MAESELSFSDGVKFQLKGPPHMERRRDGLYVVDEGMLCPVENEAEANKLIEMLKSEIHD